MKKEKEIIRSTLKKLDSIINSMKELEEKQKVLMEEQKMLTKLLISYIKNTPDAIDIISYLEQLDTTINELYNNMDQPHIRNSLSYPSYLLNRYYEVNNALAENS